VHLLAQHAVRRDSPHHGQTREPFGSQRAARSLHQRFDGGEFEARCDVRDILLGECTLPASPLDLEGDRGLETRVGEVEPRLLLHRPREVDGPGVAGFSRLRDRGPTGKAETEQLRHLVEGLADGVVAGLPEQPRLRVVAHVIQRRVTARDHEPEVRLPDAALAQLGGDQVALEMVHAHDGQAGAVGKGLAEREPHEE